MPERKSSDDNRDGNPSGRAGNLRARRIALTGGIASGKSTVARMLEAKGARVLDADQAARRAVEPGRPAWRRLREFLPADFFLAGSGELDRRRLRRAILEDNDLRRRVNEAIHPHVLQEMEEAWGRLVEADPHRPVLFDIPLLYEAGLEASFDCVLLVYAHPEVQIQRLCARDGVGREEAEKTLRIQLPIQHKKAWADLVIDNSLDLENTRRQVDEVWRKLTTGFPEKRMLHGDPAQA
jgi:dephospho-CoA kinase